jgi:predicted N-acetyltransferase YhbS
MNLSLNAPFSIAAALAGPTMSRVSPIRIVDERPGDFAARETLLDEALGPGRFEKTSARLRDGRLPARGLALVARDERGALVGTLRCWHVRAGGRAALLLGPLAVVRSHRSLGLGARLMREALWRAAIGGHKAVLLVGDAAYYARFGFEASFTTRLQLPGPVDRGRFLAFEIERGALDGVEGLVVATGARGGVRRRPQPMMKQAA